MYTNLSDFDTCHHIDHCHDLTSVDVYVHSGNARRLVASFQSWIDAMDFAHEQSYVLTRDGHIGTILIVVRSSGFIASQININR